MTGRDEPGEQCGPDEANETPASFPALCPTLIPAPNPLSCYRELSLSSPCLPPNPVSLRHWIFSIGPVLTHLLYRDAGSLRVTHGTLLACASTPTSSRSLDPWMPCFPCFPAHYQQSTSVFSVVVLAVLPNLDPSIGYNSPKSDAQDYNESGKEWEIMHFNKSSNSLLRAIVGYGKSGVETIDYNEQKQQTSSVKLPQPDPFLSLCLKPCLPSRPSPTKSNP